MPEASPHGAGGALVLATATAADEHARQRLVGWWAAAGGAGMAAGPLIGGALVALADWLAVFAVNVVIGIPAIVWSLRSIPVLPRRVRRFGHRRHGTATALIGGLVFALSLMLQQGQGLNALTSGLLVLPLTGLISVSSLTAAPLARRVGRRAVPGIGQAVLEVTLLAVAWASTSHALWPLVLALVPAGFSSGLLVRTMTSQSMAAIATAVTLALTTVTRPARW